MASELDEYLAEAEDPAYVRVVTVKVLLRQDLVARHAELEAALADAIARDTKSNDPDEAPVISQQILDLQEEMEARTREYRFRNIGKKAWADLLAEHPPTKEQAAAIKGAGFNPETFPIAAIAAACVKPEGVDEDVVRRFEATMTDSQFSSLWKACFDANLGGDIPKSLAAGRILRVNGQYASSVSAMDALSVAASS